MIIRTQYAIIYRASDGWDTGGIDTNLMTLLNPRHWPYIHSIGRNYTSSGRWWYSYRADVRRINMWPLSIWL